MGLTEEFDWLYCRHCSGIPVEFLRALAKKESNENPLEAKHPAFGLLQVVPVARESFNEAHGTNFAHEDLLVPEVNVTIACDLLNAIIDNYLRFHPGSFPFADWQDRTFVELLVFGWNAGFSERAGVGFVVTTLERRGSAVTLEAVHQEAQQNPRAHPTLTERQRFHFARAVTDLYFQEAGLG